MTEKVILELSLSMSEPNTVSITDPHSSDLLKWIGTIRQVSSPFPDRAITILTTYTMLHNEQHQGENYAFRRRLMASPVSIDDKDREIWMYPKASLEEKMAEFKSGERFEIGVKYPHMGWWTWDSLDQDLRSKNYARWSFPEELPLDRAPEDDETEDMSHRLEDRVYGHDVNYLNSASAVEDEQVPQTGQMRPEGWVFGEPMDGQEVVLDDKAVFEFVA